MDPNASAQERNQAPTPKRRKDAATKGQVVRSRELNTMMVTLGGATTLLFIGSLMMAEITEYMATALAMAGQPGDAGKVGPGLALARDALVSILVPFLTLAALLALAGPAMTGGLMPRLNRIKFKPEHLDPLRGVARMFSVRSAMELFKAILKFVLIAGVSVALFWAYHPDLLNIGRMPLAIGLGAGATTLLTLFVALSSTLLLIAGIDLPFQFAQHLKQLRMTRQEVKDENKETEGHPEVKRRIRHLQLLAAQRRLEAVVPSATMVVTNPTHYAVALSYDETEGVPVVLARGGGDLAGQIVAIARRCEIPVVQVPPLARALFFSVTEGQPIPTELYRAVAQVLVYVLALASGARPSPPQIPTEMIPKAMRQRGRS